MSSAADRYKGLGDRYEESYSTRESSGRYRSIFKDESSLKLWSPEKGEHEIDIIPYFAGKQDPRVVSGRVREGDPVYVLDLWVHRQVGVTEDNYVCPAVNYRSPCPICEEIKQIRQQEDFDEELVKRLNSKRRVVYNIWVHDGGKDEEMGVQILEISHFFMEKILIGLSRRPRGGGFIPFPDPVEGKRVFFDRTGVGAKNTKYERYQFMDRKEPIPEDILGSALCLDDLIYVPTYQELDKAFHGGDFSGDVSSMESESTSSQNTSSSYVDKRTCYGGGTMGRDFQKLDLCGDCPIWDECEKIAKEQPLEAGQTRRGK